MKALEWRKRFLIGLSIITAGVAGAQQHVFVAPTVIGTSDGTSWATAFTNLQTAIASANATNGVWVKQGVYSIATPIVMSNSVSIYGGFAGTEAALSERNWRIYTTTISNSVTATSGDIDHRVFNCDNKSNWRLDGLTIRNGEQYVASGNQVTQRGGNIRALSITGNCAIDNCIIRDGTYRSTSLYGAGVAASISSPHTLSFSNTVFYNNAGNSSGGGAYLESTGAITFKNCVFSSNKGYHGVAMHIVDNNSNVKVVNCVFHGNQEGGGGTGIIRISGAPSTPLIANCVFMNNTGSSAAIYENSATADPQVQNCLFQGNAYVYRDFDLSSNMTTVAELNGLAEATNNISGDPMFANAAVLDFRIRADSPCVDAGGTAGGNAPATDYYGNPRPVDRPTTGANGTGAEYDIGIYEVSLSQNPVYVAPAVAGISDGLTWGTAFTNLQTAINDANAFNGIWVKQGVYAITTPLVMRDYIDLYGGFSGTETALSQRNWRTCNSIVSNAVTATEVDPNHRVFNCDGKASWRLDGLIIQSGQFWSTNNSTDYSNNQGAGVRALNVTGNCTIANCMIRDCKPGNVNLYAGGIALSVNSPNTMQFNNTVFYNNQGTSGGGAYIDGSGTVTMKNCIFASNHGTSYGNGNGAGLLIKGSAAKIVNCVFYGNYWVAADRGSAIRVDGANALIANCVFMTNLESAAIAELATGADPQVMNCLFFGNYRVYRDEATTDFTDVSQLNALAESDNNIANDPKFVNSAALDFTLPASSPCVDAGTDAGGYAPTNDFYGNPRPIVRVNASTPYDIGIYEIGPQRGSVVMIQ